MSKDFEILMENLFETYTEYGKIPTTSREFQNKFDPLDYKHVLGKILEAYDIIDDEVFTSNLEGNEYE